VNAPRTLRLALDQNFPTPLINAVRSYLPAELDLRSLREIDPRLSDLDDRPLFIALHQLGLDGLITNNYKMLDVPTEIAAIVKTKMIVIAIEGLGHDPLRAVGALLLELPGLAGRIRPRTSNVFRLAYRRRAPEEAWTYLQRAAERRGEEPRALWRRVAVSDDELAQPVLAEA
jgi:hypothetical protein